MYIFKVNHNLYENIKLLMYFIVKCKFIYKIKIYLLQVTQHFI